MAGGNARSYISLGGRDSNWGPRGGSHPGHHDYPCMSVWADTVVAGRGWLIPCGGSLHLCRFYVDLSASSTRRILCWRLMPEAKILTHCAHCCMSPQKPAVLVPKRTVSLLHNSQQNPSRSMILGVASPELLRCPSYGSYSPLPWTSSPFRPAEVPAMLPVASWGFLHLPQHRRCGSHFWLPSGGLNSKNPISESVPTTTPHINHKASFPSNRL